MYLKKIHIASRCFVNGESITPLFKITNIVFIKNTYLHCLLQSKTVRGEAEAPPVWPRRQTNMSRHLL